MNKYEALMRSVTLKLLIRVKLYELLEVLVEMDNEHILRAIQQRQFTDVIMVRD